MSFLILAGDLLGVLFNPEEGGSMVFQNISELLLDVASNYIIECMSDKSLVYTYLCNQICAGHFQTEKRAVSSSTHK
jgi:hypothetical protein